MTSLSPIQPTRRAHVAFCPGCENPVLVRDLCGDSAAMQCPRCGTFVRPEDLVTYVREEGEDGS